MHACMYVSACVQRWPCTYVRTYVRTMYVCMYIHCAHTSVATIIPLHDISRYVLLTIGYTKHTSRHDTGVRYTSLQAALLCLQLVCNSRPIPVQPFSGTNGTGREHQSLIKKARTRSGLCETSL